MKLNDTEYLDFIEQDILYVWGCPDYIFTFIRLEQLERITMDPALRKAVAGLKMKLIRTYVNDQVYLNQYMKIRRDLKRVTNKKLELARQLVEMEKEEKKR